MWEALSWDCELFPWQCIWLTIHSTTFATTCYHYKYMTFGIKVYIYISKHGWKMLTICQLRYDLPLQPSGGRSRSSQRGSRPLAPLARSEEETTPRSKVGGGGIKQRGAFAISTLCGKVTCFKFQSCPRPQGPPCTVLNIPGFSCQSDQSAAQEKHKCVHKVFSIHPRVRVQVSLRSARQDVASKKFKNIRELLWASSKVNSFTSKYFWT